VEQGAAAAAPIFAASTVRRERENGG